VRRLHHLERLFGGGGDLRRAHAPWSQASRARGSALPLNWSRQARAPIPAGSVSATGGNSGIGRTG
jgi:hypothetical protein